MATVGRVVVLIWVDILAIYAIYVMMAYLTEVWDLSFTKAAAIINAFWGVVSLSPLFLTFLVDTIIGNYWMLLLSSISYSVGLGLLTMSTPPVLANSMGNCSEYKPECIGHGQQVLFYTAMPLIAFGMSGHLTSFNGFLAEQFSGEDQNNLDKRTFWRACSGVLATVIVTFVGVTALPYIKPWSLRFGIPAICTLVATLLFFSGSCSYKYFRPPGSPITIFFRVFFAATSKLLYGSPIDSNELYEINDPRFYQVPHTKSLRCLDKAAIVKPTQPREEQEKSLWKLCTVTEVEETKIIIRMIPVWMTFIFCGVVSAIGYSFFILQLENLNPKVGRLKVPIVVFLWFYEETQNQCAKLYVKFENFLAQSGSKKFAPFIGIVISMILAILCCITAAKVENRRLGVVQKHGLVNKPDERVPMTMFWLLPQFVLLGLFNGFFNWSSVSFFFDQSPVSTKRYLPFFINGVIGLGTLGSVLSVFVVGKVSERGGKTNWFQHDLNGSRLDKYYGTLSWLMAINLVVYLVVAIFYSYSESKLKEEEEEAPEFGGIEEPYDDNSKCFCCCC